MTKDNNIVSFARILTPILDRRIKQCEELARGANTETDRAGFQGKADGYKAVKELLEEMTE